MNMPALPQTDSIQELARFWDTHDVTDFADQLEVVAESVFQREATIKISLEPQEAELVAALAAAKGVSHAALIRQWVLEKIQLS